MKCEVQPAQAAAMEDGDGGGMTYQLPSEYDSTDISFSMIQLCCHCRKTGFPFPHEER